MQTAASPFKGNLDAGRMGFAAAITDRMVGVSSWHLASQTLWPCSCFCLLLPCIYLFADTGKGFHGGIWPLVLRLLLILLWCFTGRTGA